MIFRATHDEAVRSISRWAYLNPNSHENRKIWPIHVYQMGETMLNLIDRRQVMVHLCIQFIEGLRTRIVDNELVEDDQTVNLTMNSFFLVSDFCLTVSS